MSYELTKGPVPEGLILDHLCRNPSCINPDHLEPVTYQVNVLRGIGPCAINATKTHCPQGHAYAGRNLFVNLKGERICRKCSAKHQRQYRLRKAACIISEKMICGSRNNATSTWRIGLLAEITMKITVGDQVDPMRLAQWVALGNELDTPFVGMTVGVGDLIQTRVGPQAFVDPNYGQGTAVTQQETLGADAVDQGGDDQGDDATDAQPAFAADGTPAPARRRGRRSNAEKAAEAAALAARTNGAAPPAAQSGNMALPPGVSAPGTQAAPVPLPPGVSASPGIATPPGMQASAPVVPLPTPVTNAVPPVAPTPAAMPQSTVAATPPGDVVPLEVFREALRQSQSANPGKISLLMRQQTWPNGTPKAPCYTAESVPETDRGVYMDVMMSM